MRKENIGYEWRKLMKIAICDDEVSQTKYLSSLVKKWAENSGSVTDGHAAVEVFRSAEAFLFAWSGDKTYDVLLLDIQMPGKNGMELARTIRQSDEDLAIIFITGFSDYIEDGYEVSALHYLLKPVNEEKLLSCLDKANRRMKTEPPTLLVECGSETLRICQDEIVALEAFAHTVMITTIHQSFEVSTGIGELEKMLDQRLFVRVHRSYLVGLRFIQKIGRTELTLDNGAIIPVSRRLYKDINRAFINFYRGEK